MLDKTTKLSFFRFFFGEKVIIFKSVNSLEKDEENKELFLIHMLLKVAETIYRFFFQKTSRKKKKKRILNIPTDTDELLLILVLILILYDNCKFLLNKRFLQQILAIFVQNKI